MIYDDVLADKIEQFILHKLLEEDNSDIVLRRNELADELQCAPSQISYVLSTRFSTTGAIWSNRGADPAASSVSSTDAEEGGSDAGPAPRTPAGGQHFHGGPRRLTV